MRRDRRQGAKGRRSTGTFLALPHDVIKSKNWQMASGICVKLVIYLASQYNGMNNGDLSATFSALRLRGWRSSDTLNNAINEAIHYGLIVKTRQGGLNKCNLFAVTWQAIDECKGKLDCEATRIPLGDWKHEKSRYKRTQGHAADHETPLTTKSRTANQESYPLNGRSRISSHQIESAP